MTITTMTILDRRPLLLVALVLVAPPLVAGCPSAPEPMQEQTSSLESLLPAPERFRPTPTDLAAAAPLVLHEHAADGHRLYRQVLTPALPDTERPALVALFLGRPDDTSAAPARILPLETVVDARLAPKGGRVAGLTANGRLLIVEPTHGRPPASWNVRAVDTGVLPGVAFSSDGARLAYSRRDDDPRPELRVHDVVRGESRPVLERGQGSADRPAFSRDGDFLFAVGSDAGTGLAQLWAIALASGHTSVLTNVGLPAPRGDGRPPPGFVPLPVGPEPARHEGEALVYHAGDARVWLPVHLDARTGSAKADSARIESFRTEASR